MTDTHVALELHHVPSLKHVPDETVVLAQVDAMAIAGDHAGRVLTAMLNDRQAVVDGLVDRPVAQDSNYSAH